jgi:hypothetical protein
MEKIYNRNCLNVVPEPPSRQRLTYLKHSVEGELFERFLTPYQWSELKRTGWVPVLGSAGGHYYVCVAQKMFYSQVMRFDGERGCSYCLSVGGGVSVRDMAMAKILLLQADEPYFCAVANGTRWRV